MPIDRKHVSETLPWLMPEVIEWLVATLRRSWTVLETGMGGSTLFFAQRVACLISYENSPAYFDKTARLIVRNNLAAVFNPRFSQDYPRVGLAELPALELAFIDGRGRVRSVIDALPHIRPGGWLVLDDSDRERYAEARAVADAASSASIVFRSGPDETTCWRIA